MYAHVTDMTGDVDSVGNPPRHIFADDRWWDLRTRDPETLAAQGWYEVDTTAERPADTATTTSEPVFTFADGAVTRTWNIIDKTPEQIAEEGKELNAQTLRDRAALAIAQNTADAAQLKTFSEATAALTNTQRDNAIRQAAGHLSRILKQLNVLIKLEVRDLDNTSGTE